MGDFIVSAKRHSLTDLFNRIASLYPGCETAKDWLNLFKPLLLQNLRRTGARFFSWSGTVSNNPLVWVELVYAGPKLSQWNIQ